MKITYSVVPVKVPSGTLLSGELLRLTPNGLGEVMIICADPREKKAARVAV